jgi:hypothetical protein
MKVRLRQESSQRKVFKIFDFYHSYNEASSIPQGIGMSFIMK